MSGGIAASARDNLGQCNTVLTELDTLDQEVSNSASNLKSADVQISALLERVSLLINEIGTAGIYTDDSPYMNASKQMAAEVTAVFEAASARGEIAFEDFFDENYREIPGTNPKQYLTRYTELCDRVLPAIQEKYVASLPHLQYAITSHRSGYLPTHNLKYSKPQGPDPVWNAANSRNRMKYPPRNVQKAAAVQSNESKFASLSTIRRDLGNGRHVMMKNASAPIFLNGKYWGYTAIGYVLPE